MKNFRIFDDTIQYIAADRCEVTPQNAFFYLSGKIGRAYELSEVRMIEELDNRLRPQKLVFKNPQAHTPSHKQR